jgi:hypothetical protein
MGVFIFVFFVIGWLACSIAVGVAAEARGRDNITWVFLALLISPLLAAIILVAYPVRFEPGGLYKGIPYRRTPGSTRIQAMLPGGTVTFRNNEEFARAIDGDTVSWEQPGEEAQGMVTTSTVWPDSLKVEFPNESSRHRFRVEQNGSVSAIDTGGERMTFPIGRLFLTLIPLHGGRDERLAMYHSIQKVLPSLSSQPA